MTEEKQIEEMAKNVCHLDRNCDECMTSFECKAMMYAKRFYNAGYRKASEVAEYAIKKVVGLIKDYAYFPIETPKGMIEQKVVDIDDIERSADEVISVLKKIYTESEKGNG